MSSDFLDRFTSGSLAEVSRALAKKSPAQIHGTDPEGMRRLKRADRIDTLDGGSAILFVNAEEWAIWSSIKDCICAHEALGGATVQDMAKWVFNGASGTKRITSILKMMSDYVRRDYENGMRYGKYRYVGDGRDLEHMPGDD